MKKEKKKKLSKDKKRTRRKLLVTSLSATMFFLVLVGSLSRIIFVNGKKYSEKAYKQQRFYSHTT